MPGMLAGAALMPGALTGGALMPGAHMGDALMGIYHIYTSEMIVSQKNLTRPDSTKV
jgi:hypothetical protein